ncbi:MAG: MBL fold metallo-hydrolase [Planctomycetota bacterium]
MSSAASHFGKPLEKPTKSYLVQKFAKLAFGPYTILGYSVAGEETVIQVPELNVCFDFGRAPQFMLSSDIVCVSHAHMDHLAGVAYYLSQRHFQGMKNSTVLVPDPMFEDVDRLMAQWRRLEGQDVPFELVGMEPGLRFDVRKDFAIEAVRTHHGRHSLGYVLIEIRQKLKPEYHDRTGDEIAQLRTDGVDVHYKLEVPLIAFLGDTSAGTVFEHDLVKNARILLTECTFFDDEHRRKAKAGKHLHMDQFAEILPTLNNESIVIGHVSRRTGVARAKHLLRKTIGSESMERVHFLMDLDDATAGGDIDEGTVAFDD